MLNNPNIGKEQANIISMFDDIAKQYDKINSYISLGVEKYWRNKSASIAIGYFKDTKIDKIVDVACGTGKMMQTWQHQFYKNGIAYQEMIGVDPSKEMLSIAENKIDEATFLDNEAGDMKIEDNSIDVISIAYGLRNIIDKKSAFSEFNRILKDDGIILVLEFIKDESSSFMSSLKETYIKNIIPLFAKVFSKNKDAFIYLGTSIENLKESDIRELFRENGFDLLHIKSFNFEATHTFVAKKIKNIKSNIKPKTESKAKLKIEPKTELKTETKIEQDVKQKEKTKEKVLDTPNVDFDTSKVVRNVGLSLFVEFFDIFADLNIENAEIIETIMTKKKTSLASTKTKVSNARKIIKANKEEEAFNIILEAKKLDEKIKSQAKKLLKKIRAK